MEQPAKVTSESRHDASNQLSRWTFFWMLPLFTSGYKKELGFSDLDKCCASDEPHAVTLIMEREWEKELRKKKLYGKKPSLLMAIIRAFGPKYFYISLIAYFCELVLRLAQPFLIGFIVRYLNEPVGTENGLSGTTTAIMGIVLIVSCFLYTAGRHRNNVMLQCVGNNVRTSLTIMLFKKVMKLSMSSLGETDVGQVVNIMANDLNRFEDLSWFLAYAIVGPVMCVIIVIVTYYYLNWQACIAGIISIVFFIALQGLMGALFNRFRRITAQITDKRVNKMSELITAMKIIKLYCWEDPFQEVIHAIRKEEMTTLTSTYYLKGINSSFFFIATRIMVFTAFITYVLTGNTLHPEAAFVILAMYDAIRISVTAHFPNAIGSGAESIIATARCQKILELDERKNVLREVQTGDRGSILCRNFHGKWTKSLLIENLIDITLDVRPGELLVVVGSVGAGKSCFLYSLLDEIEKISGTCLLSGTASYAPQESWCFGGSVKDNILLSSQFDPVKFNNVVKVCGLERDLELFPEAENTFVGEKGYSLSGGQKARISLARAVYHDSDVYLLDDPLSAVDPKVGNHIFSKCIKGFLQKQGRTVVLVTHQLQFLKEADKVLVLNEGKIVAFGSYAELLYSNFDFFSHLKSNDADGDVKKKKADVSIPRSISMKTKSFSESIDEPIDFLDEEPAIPNDNSREEQATIGAFDPRLYWKYIQASECYFLMFLSLFLSFFGQGLFQFTDVWLSAWTSKDESTNTSAWGAPYITREENYNVLIYSVLIVVLFVVVFSRTTLTYFVCLKSSVNIHNSVFKSLLRAPISFYETNPLGVLVLSCVLNYYLIIPCVILACAAVPIRDFYIRTARTIQRLDSIARSPTYDHVSATLHGLAAVRAYRIEQKLEDQFFRYVSDSVACRFFVMSTQRALGFLMDFLSNLYILAVICVVLASKDVLSGGDGGLMLSSSLQIMGFFQYCIRLSCDLETQMISCERVMEYNNIVPEAPLKIAGKEADPLWPSKGAIVLKKVFLWYSKSMPPVLNDVNLRIDSREKIGVVGRTGAGKSTLVSVLFRLVEADGTILIDGVDIRSLGLHDVRNKISIIPQDPVIFSGTIRHNLDPFGRHPSDSIWDALQESNLDVAVKAMPGNLDANVSEGGSNLSVGQRQLLCLARALLKKSKILVCDEATANVDHETDELIRKTIRTKFNHCTVLTVAHRLNTIIEADKVIVMDAGRVMEFDEPYNLLGNADGLFSAMVRETGVEHAKMLRKQAEDAFFLRHNVPDPKPD